MGLRRILGEEYHIEIPDSPTGILRAIQEMGLSGYLLEESGVKNYIRVKRGNDKGDLGEIEIPSIPGGLLFIEERWHINKWPLADGEWFLGGDIRFEYLEDSNARDLERIRQELRKIGLIRR